MLLRVAYIVVLNAAFVVALVWYVPISSLLEARGYRSEQVVAVKRILADSVGPVPEVPAMPGQSPRGAAPADGAAQAGAGQAAEAARPAGAQEAGPQQAAPAEPAPPETLVATAVVNVRAQQSTNSQVVGRVPQGTTVEVVDDPGGDWVEVDYGDGTGWVYRPLFETAGE